MPAPLCSRRGALSGGAALMAAPAARAAAREVKVTLLGQALLEHDLRAQVWPDRKRVTRLIGRSEVGFTNLETVIKSSIVGPATREELTLHAGEPVVLDCLKSLNINLVATANNHAFDLGAGGIRSTLTALDAAGLPHGGSGLDLKGAAAPAFKSTRSGAKVAVVAFATGKVREGGAAAINRPGVNEVRETSPGVLNADDLQRVLDSVSRAARTADVVIAYQHNHLWGDDMAVTYPWQRAAAKRCIDAGASVYVAHGAPLIHGMEIYRDAPIFYGLGNFIFQTETPPGNYPRRAWDGLIVNCAFRAGGRPRISFTPLVLNEIGLGGPGDQATRGRPSLAGASDAARILNDFAERSRAFGVTIGVSGGVGALAG